MNWPPIDVPVIGRSGLIALVALLHFPFFVNFVMGAPVIAVISEWLGQKTGNPFYNRISKHLSNMALVTVGIGAFGGIALVASNFSVSIDIVNFKFANLAETELTRALKSTSLARITVASR